MIVCLLLIGAGISADELPAAHALADEAVAEHAVSQEPTSEFVDEPSARSTRAAADAPSEAPEAGAVAADTDSALGPQGAAEIDSSNDASTDAAVGSTMDNAADPWEGFNRGTFAFNEFADRIVLRPVAKAYRAVMPDLAERGVHNALENLSQPLIAVNQLLQGKPDLAAHDAGRFLLNSTVGLVGLIDIAAQLGLAPHNEDFGQTLGVWGAPQGPFLMLPFLGPSTPTTVVGSVVDTLFRPTTWLDPMTARYVITAVRVVDTRAQLLEAEGLVTGDRYAFIRDAYVQRRAYLQADGVVDDPFLDDAEDE